MKAVHAFLVACSFAAITTPSSAALISKHFQFTADFTDVAGAPMDTVFGEIKISFDDAATIFTSQAFTLTGLNIPVSSTPNFSYNAGTKDLIFGTLTSPYSYGTRRTHNDFGFYYNLATDSISTLGMTNSSGEFYLSPNVPVTPAAVPEPASWAMMIGGLGLVGGAMRRRKTAIAFA